MSVAILTTACIVSGCSKSDELFPSELVNFKAYDKNPVFAGTDEDTWDERIRERGYILREGNQWHMWYTGYRQTGDTTRYLGYASSPDGLNWTRHPDNPIFDESWVEDMQVVKQGDTYYMVAEGLNDIAHMMTSHDGIHWNDLGNLDIRYTNGQPLSAGAYGTPTLWIEGDVWNLFYEREDKGIWLARSADRKVWTNVQDDPVIACGPESYDKSAVALNQVIHYKGRYYGVYHANDDPDWKAPWTTCIAVSDDLIHWIKYPANPIIGNNFSSGIFVDDGRQLLLYTMHPSVRLFYPVVEK
ncbi:MAG: glycosylase [Verrucomicrobiae bacterium]|nr:glycosylase [Verrucomicrobiae bacterium]